VEFTNQDKQTKDDQLLFHGVNFRDIPPHGGTPFTVSTDHQASLSCANLPADSAFYGVSVRRLIALRPASFRHRLAALPLPFASRCCFERIEAGGHRQGTCTPEFIPMLGVHNQLQLDAGPSRSKFSARLFILVFLLTLFPAAPLNWSVRSA